MDLSEFGNWKAIEGYDYRISDKGFLLNNKTMKMTRGSANALGYQQVGMTCDKVRKTFLVHIIIANAFMDNPNGYDRVDHIDHNKSNNDIDNLRWCSQSQNCMNMSKQSNTTSTYKGVSWNKHAKKWHAYIMINYKRKHIGLFECEVQAAVAYNNAAIQLFEEFACLNIIPVENVIDM